MTSVADCQLITLPRIPSEAGTITTVVGEREIPFSIERIYYLYDVPAGEARGGHAHRELEQLLVAPIGSLDLVLDDGSSRRTVQLNRPYIGLLMPRMIWRELVNFSAGGICLVLASRRYEEADYIRDYDQFLAARRSM